MKSVLNNKEIIFSFEKIYDGGLLADSQWSVFEEVIKITENIGFKLSKILERMWKNILALKVKQTDSLKSLSFMNIHVSLVF